MTEQPELLPDSVVPSLRDESERQRWLERLRQHLRDPQFRATPGFPNASDEAILALSDPPYYTACPNPFLSEILEGWSQARASQQAPIINQQSSIINPEYHRDPFAADVSEGKNDPIYNAHSYHTKVPHKAIMRYILHYTDPGDVVLDGFCGTGMTGVAAQLCGDRKTVESLGYRVDQEGVIWDGDKAVSRLGARKAVLIDLSPAATFIAYNYNTPVDARAFEREAKRILAEVEKECGWMYETYHVQAASCRLIENKNFPPVWTASSRPEASRPEEPAAPHENPPRDDQTGITEFTVRQGDLPHWQFPGAHYFITFSTHNRRVLSEPARQIVLDALRFWDGQRLDLISAVVMPDHVHAVIAPREKSPGVYWDLSELMHSIKSFSANKINEVENRRGETVWLSETYDHIIRNADAYQRILSYIAYNPMKRGLVSEVGEYRWYYLADLLAREGWKPSPPGKINYTVWSDVFLCPQCGAEMVFWDVAVDHEQGAVRDDWHCPRCQALLSKSPRKESRALRAERAFETKYDRALGRTIRQAKQVPVLINYSVGKKRYEKRPDEADLALIEKIEASDIPYPFPTHPLPKGDKTSDPFNVGITHVHYFYTRRNLWALAVVHHKIWESRLPHSLKLRLLFLLSSYNMTHSTKMTRMIFKAKGTKPLLTGHQSGTLYTSSLPLEKNVLWGLSGKIGTVSDSVFQSQSQNVLIASTSSNSLSSAPENSIDYIFIDPPFGANLMYSELNFLWEAWLGVFTDNAPEAVVNKTQRKGLPEYQALMEACFREFYRVLKPGRWMTVEFHNSQNAVWNAIQEALLRAGFMVADVRTIDKQQGTFNQVTTTGAVKQDLIISAYKPAAEFERAFQAEAGTPQGVWDFTRQHLERLAKPSLTAQGTLTFVAERAPYLLYDRMVAWHIQRGLPVPLSAPEFYAGLKERFTEREGMVFTFPQAAEFDALRLQAERVEQLPLFITDEKSALQWLRRTLDPAQGGAPQTYADLANRFKQELHQVPYEALPELHDLLKENFLQDEAGRWRLPDPGKAGDLHALREKSLLREFALYQKGKGRLKTFRLEAVRAGFSRAWKERDYDTIVQVAARLPERAFEDDPQLLMYADNARIRAQAQPRQESLL